MILYSEGNSIFPKMFLTIVWDEIQFLRPSSIKIFSRQKSAKMQKIMRFHVFCQTSFLFDYRGWIWVHTKYKKLMISTTTLLEKAELIWRIVEHWIRDHPNITWSNVGKFFQNRWSRVRFSSTLYRSCIDHGGGGSTPKNWKFLIT